MAQSGQSKIERETWFEVRVLLQVPGVDENDAINRVVGAVRASDVPGLYPVGDFSAREVENPITKARRRLE